MQLVRRARESVNYEQMSARVAKLSNFRTSRRARERSLLERQLESDHRPGLEGHVLSKFHGVAFRFFGA